ncbi:MAG: hypothetical protein D6790_04395, partial [Caldilineae bacterium]
MTTDTLVLDRDAYAALTEAAALQDRSDWGVLTLGDADRVDFLQRMTTNHIAALVPGQAALTILTSPVARMEFVFTVLHRGEELWLLPAAGEAAALAAKLRSQIFFMDKVTVQDVSPRLARLRLMGPQGEETLAKADLPRPPQNDEFVEADGITVLRQEKFDIPGWELIVDAERRGSVVQALVEAGAVLLEEDAAYHTRRVELGRPLPAAELIQDYNPLEAGMAWACAENKGCYTGQEIIARQRTYDKVTKGLVQLRSEQHLPPGAPLIAEGRTVGAVTSSAYS